MNFLFENTQVMKSLNKKSIKEQTMSFKITECRLIIARIFLAD